MYLGDQKFLHAPSTGDVVKVSSLDEPYYAGQFAGGRRFDEGAPVAAAPRRGRPPRAAPAVDPTEVAQAQAAVARDAAEVRRQDSALFLAVKAEEATKETREAPVGAVPEGGRPVAGQAPRGAGRSARRAPPPRSHRRRRRPLRSPRPRRSRPSPPPSIDLTNAATDYPGDNASQEELAKWLGQAGREGRAPARAAGDGVARRVRRQEPQPRRRRLGRVLPDAGRDLEQGRVRRLSRRSPSCRPSGSSTPRSTSSATRSPRATPTSARTRRSGASGSPTPSGPPSSTATATSCASTRRASC